MRTTRSLIASLALVLLFAAGAALTGATGAAAADATTLQGCLADGPADGWYVLQVKSGEKTEEVRVEGNASFEAHLGHEVKLTGTWVETDGRKHFRATAMQHIAATCAG